MLKSFLTTLNIVPTRVKAVNNIEKYILTLQIIHKQSSNLFSKNSFPWWCQQWEIYWYEIDLEISEVI